MGEFVVDAAVFFLERNRKREQFLLGKIGEIPHPSHGGRHIFVPGCIAQYRFKCIHGLGPRNFDLPAKDGLPDRIGNSTAGNHSFAEVEWL